MKWAFLDKTESIINQKVVLAEKISARIAAMTPAEKQQLTEDKKALSDFQDNDIV